MDSNPSSNLTPVELPTAKVVFLVFLSLLLFFSGVFVWLTPLPLIYGLRHSKRPHSSSSLLLAFALLVGLYLGLFPWVMGRVGLERALQYFFWLPGAGFFPEGEVLKMMSFGLSYYLLFVVMAVFLVRYEKKAYSFPRMLLQIGGILGFGLFVWLLFYTRGNFALFFKELESSFYHLFQQMISTNATQDPAMQEQLALLQEHLKTAVYYFVLLMPAMLMNMFLFVLWLNVQVGRRLFARSGLFANTGGFSQWELPFFFVWTIIGWALLLLLDIYWLKVEFLKIIALNFFLVFALLYFFQGLAITSFYMQKWIFSPLIRLSFYLVLLIFFQPVSLLLMTFGFFDSWFDFRKLTPKPAGS